MTEKGWKYAERRIAAALGGKRIPVSGRQRGDAADISHPELSIECKSRKSVPAWLTQAMEQAQAASTDDRLPVSVIHIQGKLYADALCVIRLADLANYLSKPDMKGESIDGSQP